MENLLRELDVEKLARALPEGEDRDRAIERAIELYVYASRAVAAAENENIDVPIVARSSGGGRGGRQ